MIRLRLSPRRGWLIVNLTIAGLAAAGVTVIAVALAAQVSVPAPPASAAGVTGPRIPGPRLASPAAAPAPGPAAATALPASAAVAVDIPAIGVHSRLERLGLNPDGSVAVPGSYQQAGWYDGSGGLGQAGPTVILGHVDSYSGPGVFFRLGALRPGDIVRVRRADGRTETFTITGVRQYPKDRFPTLAVYAPTSIPTIRLITCGGGFDPASGHYLANIIAFGQLASPR